MSLQDASNAIQYMDARNRITRDPTLNPWEQGKLLFALEKAKDFQPVEGPLLTTQQVVHGAIGAGLGYGLGTLAARWLGLPESTTNALQAAGAGLGTIMNQTKTAYDLYERDAKTAFRVGFLKKAAELGLLKTAGPVLFPIPTLPLTPETFAAPIRGAMGVFNRGVQGIGAVAGNLDAADQTDQDVLRMEAETQGLNRKADTLGARRTTRLLQQILARRVA